MAGWVRFILAGVVSLLSFAVVWALLSPAIGSADAAAWASAVSGVVGAASFIWAAADRQPRAEPAPSDNGPVRVGRIPERADCFQHRHVAEEIDQAMTEDGAPLVLAGLAGVGKTQVAAEVARRADSRREVYLLMWITASDRQAIISSYAEAAIRILGADATNPTAAARRLLDWLKATPKRWLIVLDDLMTFADLDDLWPPSNLTGRVVVTTRRSDSVVTHHGRRLVLVDQFSPGEAATYLTEKFRDHPHRLVEADLLAKDLGFLPLALGQAATYIADRDIDAATYRALLPDEDRTLDQLTPEDGARPDAYPRTYPAAVELSVDAADQLNPAGLARPMLVVLSVLDANGIPIAALTSSPVLEFLAAHRTGGPSATPVRAHDATGALACLRRLSLIAVTLAGDPSPVRVHALVQLVARGHARPALGAAARAAADALVAIWPDIERDLTYCELLRSNTAALRQHANGHLWQPGAHPVLFRAGQSLGDTGLAAAAVTYFEQLAGTATKMLGADHRDTLHARGDLAYWRGEAGDKLAAVAASTALLADYERVLGHNDPDTLQARSDRALWLGLSGDVTGAVASHEALLTDRLRVLGPDHPDTLRTRINVAYWQGEAGDAAGAAVAFETLLADYLRVLGPDDPDTLRTRLNLAHWRGTAGDAPGALAALQALLVDYNRVLGAEHPYTLRLRNALAYWRWQAGNRSGAVTEFETLLDDCERLLSPGHSLITMIRDNLRQARDGLGKRRLNRVRSWRWPRRK